MTEHRDSGPDVPASSRGQARRDEIVSVAVGVIAEHGYRGLTFGEVAKRVGLTQQGVLHYFPSKEELLIGVLRQRDEWDVSAPFVKGRQVPASPLEQMEMLVDVNAMRPEIVRTFSALLGESITGKHPAGPYFKDRYEWVRESMTDTVEREYGSVTPSGISASDAAVILIAMMDGLQFQWLHDPDGVDMPQVFRTVTRLLAGE
ncbi:TetR/AcrR family transcriptional regulator [Haloglycomyces albus]|uniref:TetR/AcrR family transcriptional regulator n=1 Tax=Haloglycomyces albus TaxID=526067 RepID=UPI00046C8C83|nr:TetR/AcrR family transcriptional regulator [Haloglycomyces albus]